MCGIIGYTGSLQAKDVLIRGLKRMEYRGYDSAGIAVQTPLGLNVKHKVGKVAGFCLLYTSNAAPFWLEKLHAQFSLEAANRLGERGLRYAKFLGAVRDVLAFRNFQKISQLQKLHGAPSFS